MRENAVQCCLLGIRALFHSRVHKQYCLLHAQDMHKIRLVKIPEWMNGLDGAPEVPSLTNELLITDSSWGNGNHSTLVLLLVGSQAPVEGPHSSLHRQH